MRGQGRLWIWLPRPSVFWCCALTAPLNSQGARGAAARDVAIHAHPVWIGLQAGPSRATAGTFADGSPWPYPPSDLHPSAVHIQTAYSICTCTRPRTPSCTAVADGPISRAIRRRMKTQMRQQDEGKRSAASVSSWSRAAARTCHPAEHKILRIRVTACILTAATTSECHGQLTTGPHVHCMCSA